MEVNGYQLRDALTRARLELHVAEQQFTNSLMAFEGETKSSPDEVVDSYLKANEKVCRLEAFQEHYNQQIMVEVQGKQMSLALAVKLKGGASRIEHMWRNATNDASDPYYGRRQLARNKEEEYAQRTISVVEAVKRAAKASRYTAALKNAIAQANTRSLQVVDIEPDLLA